MKKQNKKLKFSVQKHHASHLHYDLRLEYQGVLLSWALPKEPSLTKGVKRLAIETNEHAIDYIFFEGIIEEGQYGAGKVELWDYGTYVLEEKQKDKIVVVFDGKKLKDRYALIQIKNKKDKSSKNWLFFKI